MATTATILMAALALTAAGCGSSKPPKPASYVGDCNGDGQVTVEELLIGTQIAQGGAPASLCPAADANRDGTVTVEEIIAANQNAQHGCPQ